MKTKLEMGIMGYSPEEKFVPNTIKTLNHLIAIIESRDIQRELKDEVIAIAKKYPHGSLEYIYKNLDTIIGKCQRILRLRNETPVVQEVTAKELPVKTNKEVRQPIVPETKAKEIKLPDPVVPEAKPKWTTTSAQVIKQERNEEIRKHQKQKKEEIERNKPLTEKELESPYEWVPGDDQELEEFRQKINYLRTNREEVKKQIEEARKIAGDQTDKMFELK